VVSEPGISPEEQVAVIDATIDDMSPQIYGHFQEKSTCRGRTRRLLNPHLYEEESSAMKVTCVCAIEDVDRLPN